MDKENNDNVIDVQALNPKAKAAPFRYLRYMPENILVLQFHTGAGYVNVPIVDAPAVKVASKENPSLDS